MSATDALGYLVFIAIMTVVAIGIVAYGFTIHWALGIIMLFIAGVVIVSFIRDLFDRVKSP